MMENAKNNELKPDSQEDIPGNQVSDQEREALVRGRRNRQGKSKAISMPMLLALGVAGFAGVTLVLGPTGVMDLFGKKEIIPTQPVSQVDLEVKAPPPDKNVRLDFGVDAAPEPTTNEDLEMKARIAQLEKMLFEVTNRKTGGEFPRAEIDRIAKETRKKIDEALQAERAAAGKEIASLRDAIAQKESNAAAELEIVRAQLEQERAALEEKKQASEAAAEAAKELDAIQRKSPSVVLDSGVTATAGVDGVQLGTNMTNDQRYLASAADAKVVTAVSAKLSDPSRTVIQGTIISAVLETAIDTQLPGSIRAQVTEPVFSFDGARILMPVGTMVVGQFSTEIKTGQKRVLIAWNRAVTPDGATIALGSTGTDTLGRSGTAGNVDNRYALKLAAAAVSSVVTAVPEVLSAVAKNKLGVPQNTGRQVILPDGAQAVVTSAADGGNLDGLSAGLGAAGALTGQTQDILNDFLSLPPVIRVPQGEEIRIFVNRDLVFK